MRWRSRRGSFSSGANYFFSVLPYGSGGGGDIQDSAIQWLGLKNSKRNIQKLGFVIYRSLILYLH